MRSEFDSSPSVKVDKRNTGLDKEVVLSCVYISPSHSRYGNEEHFDDLDNFLLTYTNDIYVDVLCGDFNAHTFTLLDFCSTVDDDDQVTAEIPYRNMSD